jgi:hypothetical protein
MLIRATCRAGHPHIRKPVQTWRHRTRTGWRKAYRRAERGLRLLRLLRRPGRPGVVRVVRAVECCLVVPQCGAEALDGLFEVPAAGVDAAEVVLRQRQHQRHQRVVRPAVVAEDFHLLRRALGHRVLVDPRGLHNRHALQIRQRPATATQKSAPAWRTWPWCSISASAAAVISSKSCMALRLVSDSAHHAP